MKKQTSPRLVKEPDKKVPQLPKGYGLEVTYTSGRKSQFGVLAHSAPKDGVLQYSNLGNRVCMIPMCNVELLEFDDRFTALLIKAKQPTG